MSTGSKRITDLEEVNVLEEKDQFLFFQNSSKKTKKITRTNLANSRGFVTSLPGVITNDGVAPNVPTGLTVETASEVDNDGTEKVYIKASINANTESDLESYGWSIRRISGTPTFDGGGNLTGYSAAQIFGADITIAKTSPSSTEGTKKTWDVRANTWYEVRVCAIDKLGNTSAFTPLNTSSVKLSSKDSTPPAAPTNVTVDSAVRAVFLDWTNATDNDLAGVKIYRSNTQALISSATRSGNEVTITTTANHGFTTGNAIIIAGLSAGTVNPNGQVAGNYAWSITVLSANTFKYTLPSGSGSETYTVTDGVAIPYSNSTLIWSGYADSYADTSITAAQQGTTFYYRLTSFDYSDNESTYQSAVKKTTPGQIDSTDVKDFAITATKRWNNTIVLEGDSWSDNTGTYTISWNQHSLYYQGVKYTVSSGSATATTQLPATTGDRVAYVYATIPGSGTSITYTVFDVTTSGAYPSLSDSQFMIATNVNGAHDLAWNALANAVIGSAWIQNAAITNAKILSLTADKIKAGSISSEIITLSGGGVLKSSGATSFSAGSGFWLEGGAGNVTKFGIGDLSGANNGYLKWNETENTLTIKGAITLTNTIPNTSVSGLGSLATQNSVSYGSITGTKPPENADVTLSAVNGGLSLTGGGLTLASGGASIKGGQTAYNTGIGFWLGDVSGTTKFSIGDPNGNYLTWNGTAITIKGSITLTNTIASTSVTGLGTLATQNSVAYGDITGTKPPTDADSTLTAINGSLSITGGGLVLASGGAAIRGGQTAYNTGNGFWLGDVSGTTKFSIGNPSGNYLTWDGSTLKVGGNLVAGTTVGSSGDSSFGLTIYSSYGIRKGRGSGQDDIGVLTFTGGQGNGVYYGAQIDLVGSVFYLDSPGSGLAGDDGSGTLQLSAGYRTGSTYDGPLDGAIIFRTLREENNQDSGTDNHGGAQRFRIELDGTVRVVYTGNATSNTDFGKVYYGTGAGVEAGLNTNPGRFVVEGSGADKHVQIKNGKIEFSSTSTTVYDTNLFRHAADQLGTDDDIVVGVGTTRYLYFYRTGAQIVWPSSDGNFTGDTVNLRKGGTNLLKTDDDFEAVSVTSTSTKRVKKNIKKYKVGLDIVENLTPVSYKRKMNDQEDIGFIAEEVNEILPVIVRKDEENIPQSMDYSKLTVVLVNAVKELSAEIKELKKKLKDANAN